MITDRIDAVTKIPASHLSPRPAAPRSVKIELTGRCNYRCGFCALRTREIQPRGDMDFPLFQRMTTEMRQAGVEEIGLFYLGESFMAPELLIEAIKWTKKTLEFPYVFLTSNASLADPEEVEACMAAGLDSLKWSMNAADEVQFASLMAVSPKYFRKALRNIKSAWEIRNAKGYSTRLYASSIQYDGDQFERMRSFLDEHVVPFVDQHYWLPLYGQMTSLSMERAKDLGFVPNAGNQGRIGALRDPLPCWSAFTEGHIRADGIVSACCFDADGRFAMGDLNRQTFMDAWNSSKFAALRQAHLDRDVKGTICEGCIAYA